MLRRRVLLVLLLAGAVALAGCGGGDGTTTAARPEIRCERPPLASEPKLPPRFPKPQGVTYVAAKRQGPTLVLDGYFEGSLKSAHDEYKSMFEEAGYDVLFDELEERDSEVTYRDPDGETSGLVALRDECDSGNISVRITNRPA
jgi:hypothetical protein